MSSSLRPCTPNSGLCTLQAQVANDSRPACPQVQGPALPPQICPVPKSAAQHPRIQAPHPLPLPSARSGLASPSGPSATPQPGRPCVLQQQAPHPRGLPPPSPHRANTRVCGTLQPYNVQCVPAPVQSPSPPTSAPSSSRCRPPTSKPGALASHPSSQWLCTPFPAPSLALPDANSAPQIRGSYTLTLGPVSSDAGPVHPLTPGTPLCPPPPPPRATGSLSDFQSCLPPMALAGAWRNPARDPWGWEDFGVPSWNSTPEETGVMGTPRKCGVVARFVFQAGFEGRPVPCLT